MGARSLTVGGPSNFLPDTPRNLIANGFFLRNLSLVAGVVQNEGTFLAASMKNVNLVTSKFSLPIIPEIYIFKPYMRR